MRIPTLLALTLLAIAVTLGVFIAIQSHRVSFSQPELLTPSDIQVSNIIDSEASISWQTSKEAEGLVSFGESPSLGSSQSDDRDSQSRPHITHFVTLKNLKENTTYYFKVRSNLNFYPAQPLSFKTGPALKSGNHNNAILGVVLRSDLQPIDEALVSLKVEGGAPLSTLTTTAGNFIMSLSTLRNESLSDNLNLDIPVKANLVIQRDGVKSNIKLILPLGDQPLPKIILGQDNDFSSLPSSPTPSPTKTNQFDLNLDGRVNSLDLSIVLQALGKKTGEKDYKIEADFNHDGVINQDDVDLMKKALSQ